MSINKRLIVAFGFALLAFGAAKPSEALIFTLAQDGCTGGCGTSPFGTVTVVQGASGNTVDVTVQLSPPWSFATNLFVSTGAGHALSFNLAGNPSVTISNITSGFAYNTNTSATGNAGFGNTGAFGNFQYGINCIACGNGASNPQPGPLNFSITTAAPLTPLNFSPNAGGYYFASDIIGANRRTGVVASRGPVAPPVPEPASLLLLGAGLAGIGAVAGQQRRRRAA